jgi:hypothetical protein
MWLLNFQPPIIESWLEFPKKSYRLVWNEYIILVFHLLLAKTNCYANKCCIIIVLVWQQTMSRPYFRVQKLSPQTPQNLNKNSDETVRKIYLWDCT